MKIPALHIIYPKVMGSVSFVLGLSVFYNLFIEGQAMSKIVTLMNAIAGDSALAEVLSLAATLLLAMAAVVLGYRGMVYNNICIAGQCTLDSTKH